MNINEQPLSVKAIEKEKSALHTLLDNSIKKITLFGYLSIFFYIGFFKIMASYSYNNNIDDYHSIIMFLTAMIIVLTFFSITLCIAISKYEWNKFITLLVFSITVIVSTYFAINKFSVHSSLILISLGLAITSQITLILCIMQFHYASIHQSKIELLEFADKEQREMS